MKVLALTRYDSLGASSRLRFFQYVPYLEEKGVTVDVSYFLSSRYVKSMQQEKRNWIEVLRGYINRIYILVKYCDYDLIWVEKEFIPWLPFEIESAFLKRAVPFVLDYDDAIFHNYDEHPSLLIRRLLSGKCASLMQTAALVIAGNQYIENYARNCGALRVEQVPTAVDLERYVPKRHSFSTDSLGSVCIGWIGQASTAKYLIQVVDVLRRVIHSPIVRFRTIGVDLKLDNLTVESVAWHECSEVEAIHDLDIGLMPLEDGLFERGKCGYKLLQYMACGLPVVASPVGVNKMIVEHGVNGFLAESESEWESALRLLISDPLLRLRMGDAGRRKVEQNFCTLVTAPRLHTLLMTACSGSEVRG